MNTGMQPADTARYSREEALESPMGTWLGLGLGSGARVRVSHWHEAEDAACHLGEVSCDREGWKPFLLDLGEGLGRALVEIALGRRVRVGRGDGVVWLAAVRLDELGAHVVHHAAAKVRERRPLGARCARRSHEVRIVVGHLQQAFGWRRASPRDGVHGVHGGAQHGPQLVPQHRLHHHARACPEVRGRGGGQALPVPNAVAAARVLAHVRQQWHVEEAGALRVEHSAWVCSEGAVDA
eukprot:scaffold15100_cov61-Phaeocystis_antarctica.AAC.6